MSTFIPNLAVTDTDTYQNVVKSGKNNKEKLLIVLVLYLS